MNEDNLTPAQRYYQRHKEARREYGRQYYLKNRDRILARAEERRAEQDEEDYIANYVAERGGGPYMASEEEEKGVSLIITEVPIEKIVPVAKSPLDAYRGRGAHTKITTKYKNGNSKTITIGGPVTVSFS